MSRSAVLGVCGTVVAVLLLGLASAMSNVTNVRLARGSIPAACPDSVIVKRVPCVWRRHFGWVCLDAPLPDRPEEDDNEEGSDA